MEFWLIVLGLIIAYNIFKKIKKSSSSQVISKTTVTLAKQGLGKRRESRRFAVIEKPDIELSAEGKEFIELLESTKTNIFLTGKAGTGKSTLLKYFRATTQKKIVVLAPTGVAAINVQGQTVHSFFKFRPNMTLDLVRRRYGNETSIYRNIDMIVIDEISMVRADLFDCVDKFMRLNGPSYNKPFGGVQVVVIGDLYQLPPVVKTEEQSFFERVYKSPFFFDSQVYKSAGFIKMELTNVYRQTDQTFIKTLDALRTCTFNDQHIALINSRVFPNFEKPKNVFLISLVTKNRIADEINAVELGKLSATPKTYKGVITGEFKDKDLPTTMDLTLKEGAQIMLLKNHPQGKWVNGDVVKVIKIEANSVRVLFDDNTFDDVGVNSWDSIRFVYDEETKKIQSEIVGTFRQLPIKLAWAITIHKSQGKTFDQVFIDFGDGTFASGQAYVALSRCRTLEGMTLGSPLESHHIFTDERIREFMNLK